MIRAILAFAMILSSLVVLERSRGGVTQVHSHVGETPMVQYARPAANGPVVVIAHGFAGSQQMMQGYALPLARAGYRVYAFDFLGHGRHSKPMSGDVTALDGTTKRLVDQTRAVIDAVAENGGRVALIGHSMATDVLVRAAEGRRDIGPMVLISAFSQAIIPEFPERLLFITGAWEARLREFALISARSVKAETQEGDTARRASVERRAIAAPWTEHVAVLHSREGRVEALAWLDRAHDRRSDVAVLPTGWAILALLSGLVLLFKPLALVMPSRAPQPETLTVWKFWTTVAVPAVVTPLIAVPFTPEFLPVLVADYLMVHLLIYGAMQLVLIGLWGLRPRSLHPWGTAVVLLWCGAIGFALDRYAANFWPTEGRIWIIAIMLAGAVPFMLADSTLAYGASLWRRVVLRTGLLTSLGIAVALDFRTLFFLIMIAPVLVLFFLVFGSVGRGAAHRCGPLAPGIALGCVLAWALGVSFPLFQS